MAAGVALVNVTKRFEKLVAVSSLSLEIKKGEFLSLLGPSGCGKTTTLRIIAGFTEPDEGDVFIDDKPMKKVNVRERCVGIVFQNYALFPNLNIMENIAFGLRARKIKEEEIKRRVNELLELIGLVDRARAYPRELSGGQQQRVALARALAINPQVLLLDEPLSALDAKVRNALRFEIKRIQRQSGIPTLYVTHDQEEALSISDRVAIMNEGKLEQVGEPLEIYTKPRTKFVADFVGDNNFFYGTYEGDGVFIWKGRQFVVASKNGESKGDACLVVRPERFRVARKGSGKNEITGTIAGKIFLGAMVRLAVKADGSDILVDLLSSDGAHFGVEDEITVSFDPDDGFLLF
ncbi:MAG TPA: ABC transporter ATP-binding protein [Thermosynergistes sp.]|nr:ABC transporter ATP-binding protein [Thermosynergistes sp.]